jgi:2-keto-4-pentenoate hydratase/2-oxohepta-3-ene-1,7-dioic acid hydratase in catechol pathway
MKLLTFSHHGRTSYGIVTDGGVIDAGARFGSTLADLRAVLAADALDNLAALATQSPDVSLNAVTILKPISSPGKIICVGVNYSGRNAEYKDGAEAPSHPSLFLRIPESFVAHLEPLVRPPESHQLDYEGEIAIVIGKPGRRIARGAALSHIAGYTICDEGTVRDWCRHGKFNVTAGKNFSRSGSMGPFLVTRDEIGDQPLRIVTCVNGELRQDATTEQMIFSIPALISYISTFSTLEPGDVVVTGTPTGAGVRFDPPRYLVPGDRVDVEVSGLGTLTNSVVDESAS